MTIPSQSHTSAPLKGLAQKASEKANSFDHLVYLRLWEGCNLQCKHCFIPANPKKMSVDTIQSVPDIVRQFAKPGQEILIQFHGGEPTGLGPSWMRDAIETIECGGPEFNWKYGIQTNLITYNDDWRDVYKKYFNGQVGVSWDYKIRSLKGSNDRYEEVFWSRLKQLTEDGLSPYLVVTGTRTFFERYSNPYEFFDLMMDMGITNVHIERLTKTGYARDNWESIGLTNRQYSEYMSRFAMAYVARIIKNDESPLFISPFDGLLGAVSSLNNKGITGGYGCWSGDCDSKFHTIDANGYKAGCTALNSEVDNGAISGIPVIPLLQSDSISDIRMHRVMTCDKCRYRAICSSGCLASTMNDGSGECAGSRMLFDTINNIL